MNKIADFEPRKINDNLEWPVQDDIFSHITNRFHRSFTIDLFASKVNKNVNRYFDFYVEPFETDAFSFSWQCEFFYAFPPFSIIHTVFRKKDDSNQNSSRKDNNRPIAYNTTLIYKAFEKISK